MLQDTVRHPDLNGRVAVITGGGRGIGRGIAEELACAGAGIVVNYRKDAIAAAETVESIEAAGGVAVAVQASMSETEAVDVLAEQALAAFGYVDIIVNNAASRAAATPSPTLTPPRSRAFWRPTQKAPTGSRTCSFPRCAHGHAVTSW